MGRVLSTMTAAGRIATPFSSSREDREESGWFGGRMEQILVQPKTKLMTFALNLDFFFTWLSGKKGVKR